MKEKNKLMIAVVAVVAITVAVVGATYAFWQWASTNSEKTNVTFTYDPGMSATINGGTMSISSLAPTTSCTGTYAAKASATLTYSNSSGSTARALGTLKVTTFTVKSGHNAFQSGDLEHLHYAVTTSSTSCSTGVISSGTFSGKGSSGSVLFTDAVLKSNITSPTTSGSQPLYVYVWIDDGYTYTNTGSGVVTDPMQDLTIVLTWSGKITNQPTT